MPRLVLDPTNPVIGTVIGTLHRPSSSSLMALPTSARERGAHGLLGIVDPVNAD
jgi:hypothetical protein